MIRWSWTGIPRNITGLHELASNLDVIPARLVIAGRVLVRERENDRGRAGQYRNLDDLREISSQVI